MVVSPGSNANTVRPASHVAATPMATMTTPMTTNCPWFASAWVSSSGNSSGRPIVNWTTRSAIAAAANPVARARNSPTRVSSARRRKTPRAPQKPAMRPMTPATGAKRALKGPAPPGMGRIDQMRLARTPVKAPAHGPARTPTKNRPDRVEVDRQAQGDGQRADGDVDRDRDRDERQGGRRKVPRAAGRDDQDDDADQDRRQIGELDRWDAVLRLPLGADLEPVEAHRNPPRPGDPPDGRPGTPSPPASVPRRTIRCQAIRSLEAPPGVIDRPSAPPSRRPARRTGPGRPAHPRPRRRRRSAGGPRSGASR